MLLESQKFALEHIYCAPAQDRQYSFKLARVNKKTFPALRQVTIYGANKSLPNTTSYFHVFTLGNLFPEFLNLQSQRKQWFKDEWIKLSDDMVARNFIAKIYNDDGVVFPRNHVYYSYNDENSLVFAIEVTSYLKQHFDIASFQYLNIYSNAYFQSAHFNQLPRRIGIEHNARMVVNNQEKAQLQNYVDGLTARGGDVFIYVDGYYTNRISLELPDLSYVEVLYDQSVVKRETIPIQHLRTFDSLKDNKMKYLLYRNKERDTIEYHDDAEVYITQNAGMHNQGLLLYRHADFVMRNVTDKDYSLLTSYVHNTAQILAQKVGGGLHDKVITLYTRHSGRERQLVYNAMKLHELYKLPHDVQKDVISNTNYTVDIYRAEYLENSPYFQVAGAASLNGISPQLALDAIGYNGITHYYANTPVATHNKRTIEVPELFQNNSIAFEYDLQGKYLRFQSTDGPLYTCTDAAVGFVDFVAGEIPLHYGSLYPPVGEILTHGMECRILSAYFEGASRRSLWEDITDDPTKCVRVGNVFTVNDSEGKKIKKVCLQHPRIYDLELPLDNGNLLVTLTQPEDRGNGALPHVLDVGYENVELFLNGHRLTEGLDFFMKFPEVSICCKRYLDYTLPAQQLHIRMTGFTLDYTQINAQEVRGFVNNGALTRNRHYDIRDDKVFSVYVDGKLRDRNHVRFSEDDNVVRITHPRNGQSYVVKEPFLAIKALTGLDSFGLYRRNLAVNKKIADFYNLVHPEPPIDEFNTIAQKHVLFSSLISTVVNDVVSGGLSPSFYTTPYDDTAILQLIDDRYKSLFLLDPVRGNLQTSLVEIHPHLGNAVIALNLLQYRFVQNVIRVITGNQIDRINISGYLSVSV